MPDRRDFLTTLIYIAAQRSLPQSASPWRILPLDMIVLIFSHLEQVGKSAVQIGALVEFIFANIADIWAYIAKERRGVKVSEAKGDPKPQLKWCPKAAQDSPKSSEPPTVARSSSQTSAEQHGCNVQ